jgi:hypothetical protein
MMAITTSNSTSVNPRRATCVPAMPTSWATGWAYDDFQNHHTRRRSSVQRFSGVQYPPA